MWYGSIIVCSFIKPNPIALYIGSSFGQTLCNILYVLILFILFNFSFILLVYTVYYVLYYIWFNVKTHCLIQIQIAVIKIRMLTVRLLECIYVPLGSSKFQKYVKRLTVRIYKVIRNTVMFRFCNQTCACMF